MILFPKPVSIKKTPKPINKVSTKKKVRLNNMWSEKDLFERRYNQLKKSNQHYCVITGTYLTEDMLSPSSFAHILAKWTYPNLRYFLNNIALVKWINEHHLLDVKINKLKKSLWEKELESQILSWKEIVFDVPFNNI
jgi:hypothetical protein